MLSWGSLGRRGEEKRSGNTSSERRFWEPKLSKIEVQERSSSQRAPGRSQKPKQNCQKCPPPFGSRFEFKTRPKNKVCSQRSFGQHLVPNNLQNEAKTAPRRDPKMTYEKHGKLCSRFSGSSLLTSHEGSKNDHVLESLFGAIWRPFLGAALENSWLQGNPERDPKGGPK